MQDNRQWLDSRRNFLRRVAFTSTALATPTLFADQLALTPRQAEGPFYPDRLPLDTDNDLIRINDSLSPALGQVTHLTGRVMTPAGHPIRSAVVEIWQADNNGVYIHSASARRDRNDPNFQGFGRFLTDSTGRYYFRTIKPVPYTGRPPHIHVAVEHKGERVLTTQCYIRGETSNERDGLFRRVQDAKSRDLLLVDFQPLAGSGANELSANFDLVLGITPEDPQDS